MKFALRFALFAATAAFIMGCSTLAPVTKIETIDTSASSYIAFGYGNPGGWILLTYYYPAGSLDVFVTNVDTKATLQLKTWGSDQNQAFAVAPGRYRITSIAQIGDGKNTLHYSIPGPVSSEFNVGASTVVYLGKFSITYQGLARVLSYTDDFDAAKSGILAANPRIKDVEKISLP